MKKVILYIFICLLVGVNASQAQEIYNEKVRIENTSVTRIQKDKTLSVAMDVILTPKLKISSNRAATLTPVLRSGEYTKVLPAIVVAGRKRGIMMKRSNSIPKDAYTTIRHKNGTEERVDYLVQVPFQKWMQGAELVMLEDLCGCGGKPEENGEDDLAVVNLVPNEKYMVMPIASYVVPQAEKIKNREEEGQAFLDFPVNQTVIYPEYRKNPSELAKIRATIDIVRNDTNTEITQIQIHGYASPEGSYANNTRLAQGRAEALKQYVRQQYNFDSKIFEVESTPEDWEGLRKFVENSDIQSKEAIMKVLDNEDTNLDVKEYRLKTIANGAPYFFMLKEWYPALRHSDYKVKYVVGGISVDEGKEIIKKRPQLLSLQEMFLIAQTYKKGSEDFNQVFDVAVRMFPEDPTANLNAAATEIGKGNTKDARKYLEKADQSLGETQNNWGIVELLDGNLEEADKYFAKAKELGIKEAETNSQETAKKREDNKLFEDFE